MNKSGLFLRLVYLYFILIIVGCGDAGVTGGGSGATVTYSGSTTPAAITADNAESVGTGAAEGTTQAVSGFVSSQNNPLGVSISDDATSVAAKVSEISQSIVSGYGSVNLPVGISLSSDQLNAAMSASNASFCGGSITLPDNYLNIGSSGTITYNNLCMNISGYGEITMDGTVTYSYSSTGSATSYSNVTVTANGQTYILNGTYACSADSCSFSQDFVSSTGSTYRVADVSITGSSSSGYYVNATFYHSDYGSVTITTSDPVLLGCSNGYPSSGTINFSGAGGSSGTITFRSDCSGYDGTYTTSTDGTGTFSGSWPA